LRGYKRKERRSQLHKDERRRRAVPQSVGHSSATVVPVTERPPLEAAIVERVHASFARQGAMATLGAEFADVAAGHVAIAVPVEPRLTQQHGFLHAGVVVAALDSACGYAALTLMPDDAEVLTVELKVNLLAPATASSRRAKSSAPAPVAR
jgi:uncharacterized protein (TIGR00369 family)